jgi:hypothetical protein
VERPQPGHPATEPPTNCPTRCFSSRAALLVNVTARILKDKPAGSRGYARCASSARVCRPPPASTEPARQEPPRLPLFGVEPRGGAPRPSYGPRDSGTCCGASSVLRGCPRRFQLCATRSHPAVYHDAGACNPSLGCIHAGRPRCLRFSSVMTSYRPCVCVSIFTPSLAGILPSSRTRNAKPGNNCRSGGRVLRPATHMTVGSRDTSE